MSTDLKAAEAGADDAAAEATDAVPVRAASVAALEADPDELAALELAAEDEAEAVALAVRDMVAPEETT